MTKINEELELIAPGIVRNCIDTVEVILRDWRDTCIDAGKTENLKNYTFFLQFFAGVDVFSKMHFCCRYIHLLTERN